MKQDLLTSVTFPSLTVQFWITSLMKGGAFEEGEGFFQEYIFGYQKRCSWFLVYFLLFLSSCHLMLLPVWVEFPLVTPDLAQLNSIYHFSTQEQLQFQQGSSKYMLFGYMFCNVLHIQYIWKFGQQGIIIKRSALSRRKGDPSNWSCTRLTETCPCPPISAQAHLLGHILACILSVKAALPRLV